MMDFPYHKSSLVRIFWIFALTTLDSLFSGRCRVSQWPVVFKLASCFQMLMLMVMVIMILLFSSSSSRRRRGSSSSRCSRCSR